MFNDENIYLFLKYKYFKFYYVFSFNVLRNALNFLFFYLFKKISNYSN